MDASRSVRLDADSPTIGCKLEFLNPSESTKDRIARYMLEKAWRLGERRLLRRLAHLESSQVKTLSRLVAFLLPGRGARK
jgi:hypothetical protein